MNGFKAHEKQHPIGISRKLPQSRLLNQVFLLNSYEWSLHLMSLYREVTWLKFLSFPVFKPKPRYVVYFILLYLFYFSMLTSLCCIVKRHEMS